MKPTKILLAICLFIGMNSIVAQTDNNSNTDPGPLVTDRPDATESPSVVSKGYLQIETGALYTKFEDGGVKLENTIFNTTLARIGILDNVELRIGWDIGETVLSFDSFLPDQKVSGFSPLLLGGKIAIAEEKNGWPQVAFIGHLSLPFTASKEIKPEYTGGDFRFAFAHSLSETSSLSYNLGAAWGNDSPELVYLYTISYGHSINEKVGIYVELYGGLPEDSSADHLWDAGVTYLVSNNVQLDATVGSSITEGQDLLVSGGVSFRVPLKSKKE